MDKKEYTFDEFWQFAKEISEEVDTWPPEKRETVYFKKDLEEIQEELLNG